MKAREMNHAVGLQLALVRQARLLRQQAADADAAKGRISPLGSTLRSRAEIVESEASYLARVIADSVGE